MKKIYNSPMVDVVVFRANDIITGSQGDISGNDTPGATIGGMAGDGDEGLAPTRGGRW